MNIEKTLKRLGFNLNMIEDKQLRIEFIALVEMLLNKYQLYGDVSDKNLYIKDKNETVDGLKDGKLVSIRIDNTKKCRTVPLFDPLTNREYDLDVIYDIVSKSYTIIFKPLTLEGFGHNLFGNSFFIKYNTLSGKMIASMISKNLDGNLLVDKYEFNNISNQELVVVNTKSVYEGLSVIEFEKKYQKLHGKLNGLYKPGEVPYCEYLKLKSRTSILSTNSIQNIQKIIVDKVKNKLARFSFKNCVIVYRHGEDKYYKKTFSNSKSKMPLLLYMLVADRCYKKYCSNKQKRYN